MRIAYKNILFERLLIAVNIFTGVLVTAAFVFLFGLKTQLLTIPILYTALYACLFVFIAEKIFRLINSVSRREFWRANWYEAPLLLVLVVVLLVAGSREDVSAVRHFAVGIYLVLQVVVKVCRTTVGLAASGRNPTQTLIASFIILILAGTGILMLPRSAKNERVGFVDALFTATSATCVTGLTVKNTGSDYTLMGQFAILALIQLGGLGIVIFGVVFAMLLGQALGIRESAAMQDILNEKTLGRISRMIAYIFSATVLIEAIGSVSLFWMWDNIPGRASDIHWRWYCSIFHSISAFCNSGFSLFPNSFIGYSRCWQIYGVICPLIILGGLGFSVLYDLTAIFVDRIKLFFRKLSGSPSLFAYEAPRKMNLQSKIVLLATFCLIVFGMITILLFERLTGSSRWDWGGAFFQSVTARTAGFNNVDIGAISASSKFILMLLMFIGGSPGGTAGGVKTTTLAVIIIATIATLNKRREVNVFRRSVGLLIVRRAITVTLLFVVVLFTAGLVLSITERQNGFTLMDVMFEASSAIGTVGLSTGITHSLTSAGKLIIIAVMFVGRVGPLTLLASLTFNLRPARYSYPEEAVMVG